VRDGCSTRHKPTIPTTTTEHLPQLLIDPARLVDHDLRAILCRRLVRHGDDTVNVVRVETDEERYVLLQLERRVERGERRDGLDGVAGLDAGTAAEALEGGVANHDCGFGTVCCRSGVEDGVGLMWMVW
jgi:hypothetical protein